MGERNSLSQNQVRPYSLGAKTTSQAGHGQAAKREIPNWMKTNSRIFRLLFAFILCASGLNAEPLPATLFDRLIYHPSLQAGESTPVNGSVLPFDTWGGFSSKVVRFATVRRDRASFEMLPVEIRSNFGGAPRRTNVVTKSLSFVTTTRPSLAASVAMS